MAVIEDSGYHGDVTFVGIRSSSTNITTEPVSTINVDYGGFEGDVHSGLTRASCVRVKRQYKKGTEIRNTRQISIVSAEELNIIAQRLNIPGIKPEWLGANLCISGIPDFTHLPPASRLLFSGGAALVGDVENLPCDFPAKVIDQIHHGVGKLFVKHSIGVRGITAWVEREGSISLADTLQVHVPAISHWAGYRSS